MKHYYAKYKGVCYAFARKIHRDSVVKGYGFEKLTAERALREFVYTDSCSRYVINCEYVPADNEKALEYVMRVRGVL